jgi:hypothetical protein
MYSETTKRILIIIQQGLHNDGYSAEGDCYNREHIIPQSTVGMVSDAHFINGLKVTKIKLEPLLFCNWFLNL